MRNARLFSAHRSSLSVAAATATLALLFLVGGLAQTENAVANGDTRTIYLYHTHTRESIAATFRVNGQYDPAVLGELNHFLRDWRNNDEINMDPKLFDVIWETYRESGSAQPIQVVSAYRSPTTNAMLRSRSKAVAEHSQHMLGKAMDMHYTDVPMSKIREIGMRLQRGGVGYYPTSGVPFVHLDVGNVRYWPRMNYDALARLFPDGKAVFLAADGRPLPHYQEARAEIAARGSGAETIAAAAQPKNFFAMLFGGGDNQSAAPAPPPRAQAAAPSRPAESEQTGSVSIRPVVTDVTTDKQQKAEDRLAAAGLRKGDGGLVLQTGAPGQPSAVTGQRIAPLPRHHPIELASLTSDAANVPLPPVRPAQVASLGGSVSGAFGVGSLLRAANVPAVITRGSNAAAASGAAGAPLAYAPAPTNAAATPTIQAIRTPASPHPAALAPAVGLRAAALRKPIEFVAARLDPSNFHTLVSPASMQRTTSQSELGSAIGALRSAARFTVSQLIFGPPSPVAVRFGRGASDLHTGNFTGPAVRPLSLQFSQSTPDAVNAAGDRRVD